MDKPILIQKGIIDVLKYFEIFKFPLTKREVHLYIGVSCTLLELELQLEKLVGDGDISSTQGTYLLQIDTSLVERKFNGARLASKKIVEAKRVAKLINYFPFVRMIGISGSLSKGYFEKGEDIDFFIVTAKNRLWVARTLLHVLKKLSFLIGKQHSLCMNYFVDETALELDDKNYFIAVELATVIPLTGLKWHESLIKENEWIYQFVPNISFQLMHVHRDNGKVSLFKRFMEGGWNSDNLNKLFMKTTDKKWRKKWSKRGFDMTKYDRAFKTTLHVSKNHPHDYQDKIMQKIGNKDS